MVEEFLNSLIIRRSDLDDSDAIEQFSNDVALKEALVRFYGAEVSVLHLIETSFLSVTALDQEGNILAFVSFDDHPPGLKVNDQKHENLWESWFQLARGVDDDLNSHNALWVKMLRVAPIDDQFHPGIIERMFQSAYSSLPMVKGILLMARGEANPEDFQVVGFTSIQSKFEEMDLYRREVLSDVRGVHFNSIIYYSERDVVIPHIEIRTARQEDHDNLATIFNAQSEVVTETYGDYFIAELIAAQDEFSRCLVGQVHDKAIGLLSVRSDIDTQLLWQCFELDIYDNLYEPTYMDIVREKREEIRERRRIESEERARQEARKLKEQTMICNRISQRMSLQEYMLEREEEIFNRLEQVMNDIDNLPQMNRRGVEGLMEEWLEHFVIQQPGEYFYSQDTVDPYLECNILSEVEFLLECLQFFGLPVDYMEGGGQYVDWYRKKEEEAKQKQANQRSLLGGKPRGAKRGKAGDRKVQEVFKPPDPPDYFDLEPLKKALRLFLDANCNNRTRFRHDANRNIGRIELCFKGEDAQLVKDAFKVNTTNFALHLEKASFPIDPTYQDVIGPMLRCFGHLNTIDSTIITQPPAPVEEEKKVAKGRGRARAQQEKEQKVQLSKEIEDGVVVDFQKDAEGNLLPVVTTLMRTSFAEVIKSLEIIEDFDITMCQLGLVKGEEIAAEVAQIEAQEAAALETQEEVRNQSQASQRDESIISAQKSQEGFAEYDENQDYLNAVSDLDDLVYIPEPPERAKNAFGLVLFCMDEAFEAFGIEFLESAFDQFPDRDYMIITQPHTVPENSLMRFFTQVTKKPNNTFNHVLYIMHRDCLNYKDIKVRVTTAQDLNHLDYLLSTFDNQDQVVELAKDAVINDMESSYMSFSVKCKDEIIGLFILSRDVNLKYYRSHFHIEDFMLLNEHRRNGHTRIYYSILNPIFLKFQTLILKDILRLMNKTCMFFEIHDMTVIPDVFNDLLYVRSRRFPHFLVKEWDHERHIKNESEGLVNQDGADRDYLDQSESQFALCFINKKYLSEPKIVVNTRIVVVGASDTGVSFIESLLSNRYLQFTNIYLLAPGGLSYYHIDEYNKNMKSSSFSYTLREYRNLLLENRVTVIDARLIEIDREEKRIILNDESVLRYDILLLTMGLQDIALKKLGYVSRGIAPVPEDRKHIDGIISIDDPYLYQHFREQGSIMAVLTHRKQPGTTVIYGYTLHSYCFIQGLINKGISPSRIKLVMPNPIFEYDEGVDPLFGGDEHILINNPAFQDDQNVLKFVHGELERLGVEIYYNSTLKEIELDEKQNLSGIVFEQDDEDVCLPCRVLVTACQVDVDDEVFQSIHGNGLVFNGRIIVNNQFQTTDENIYAAGTLCEFSQELRVLAPGRCLRMDRYNGREVGIRVARSILNVLEIEALQGLYDEGKEEVPYFYMPRGKGGMLPGGYHYYHIAAPVYGDPQMYRDREKNRDDVIGDTIRFGEDGEVTGHYIRFTFNNYGIIDSVTYFSKNPIVIQSLWSFVGLSETYLNKLTVRFKSGIIPDVAEFLSENWAMALYHDWFADFSMKLKSVVRENIASVLEHVKGLIDNKEELTREQVDKLKSLVPTEVKRLIHEQTLEYIRANQNHLPMYYIPGVEFE